MELARTLSPTNPFNSKHIMAFSSPSHYEGHLSDDNRNKKHNDFPPRTSPRMPNSFSGLSVTYDDAGFNLQGSPNKMYSSSSASSGHPATRTLEASYSPPYQDPNVNLSRGYPPNVPVYMDQATPSYLSSLDSPPYSSSPSMGYSTTSSSTLDPTSSYQYSYGTSSHGYAQHTMPYPQPSHYSPYPSRRPSVSAGEMVQPSGYMSSYLDDPQRRSLPDTPSGDFVHRRTSPNSLPTRSASGSPLVSYGHPKPVSDVSAVSTRNSNRPLYTHREQLQFFKDAVVNCPMASEVGPFIPQTMYKPHTTSDRRRYVEEVDLEAPIYFWVNHPTECGISLSDALHSRVKRLQNRDECVFEGRGPSVSIRLEWPGYRQWSRQIPTKDFRSPPGPITRAKLAKNVAKCVQRFISERSNHPEPDGDTRFRIGTGASQIKLDDLILVSIHHVSMGSWQPQLRLRRPFRTPSSTPPLTTTSPVQGL